jgi:uncharacterized protein YlxP (DUF503 family)
MKKMWKLKEKRIVIRPVCVELHVTVDYTKTKSVAQQSLHKKSMAPITLN